MKKFEFNVHGVCTNPNVIEYEKGVCRFRIETAYTHDVWICGFSFTKEANGVSDACIGRKGRCFPKEKDAVLYVANEALEFFNEKHYGSSNNDYFIKVSKEIFEKLDDIINPKPRELDLFAEYNFNE